jgi:hypothetical protein
LQIFNQPQHNHTEEIHTYRGFNPSHYKTIENRWPSKKYTIKGKKRKRLETQKQQSPQTNYKTKTEIPTQKNKQCTKETRGPTEKETRKCMHAEETKGKGKLKYIKKKNRCNSDITLTRGNSNRSCG